MKLPLPPIIHLLHEAEALTLATHSTQLPGYPYATVLPCVTDGGHCPVLCVSALAEHTKNLLADPRVSLSLAADAGNVQTAARLTIVGDAVRFEPTPQLRARYLRYQPDAQQYLALDFMFFRIRIQRLRFIAGLGQMGWIEAETWAELPALTEQAEATLLGDAIPLAPAGIHVLGVDAYGVDFSVAGRRRRQRFADPVAPDKLPGVVARIVPRLG